MAFKSNDKTFEKVYGIFDKRDYFNTQGLAKTQIGNFERALQKNDKGAQQILDKFKGDMGKAKDYITQVITDRKKEDAFNQYKAFKAAVDSIQKGKPIYGAVDLVKSRIHNSSQKYTIALYSALSNKKFTKWKDVHDDVDSLIGESVNESAEDAGKAIIPAAIKIRLQKAMDVLDGKKLTYQQKIKVLGKVIDSLGIDKSELNKISQKIRTKLESVNESKQEVIQLKKKVGNNETKFYDILSTVEKKYGKNKYRIWLEKSLKEFGENPKHYDYRTNAAAEEKLFQLAK